MKYLNRLLMVCAASILVACGGGGGSNCALGALTCGSSSNANPVSGSNSSGAVSVVNIAPVANAGTNQTVLTNTEVTLDASASSDANNDKLTYQWSIISSPAGFALTVNEAKAENAALIRPKFTPTLTGTYVFGLVVSDGKLQSQKEVVTVTAVPLNYAPVAVVGPAKLVVTGSPVVLDASDSTDANNDKLNFLWTLISKPALSNVALTAATAALVKPSFVPDVSGVYVFGLVVSDTKLSSQREVITITATPDNLPPVANAGIDQSVTLATPPTAVTLNGTASTDPNFDSLTYTWTWLSQPAGSAVTFDVATSPKPKFTPVLPGTYVANLVVSDGKLSSPSDAVTVVVSRLNSAPVAVAGVDQSVLLGSTVTLNGLGSIDADADALTYKWTLNKPSGSAAVLVTTVPEKPTFVADLSGTYVASLVVSDNKSDSANVSTVRVTAAAANGAPVAVAAASPTTVSLAAAAAAKLVTLDGSGSSDPNADALTYTWLLTTAPVGSTSTLTVDPVNKAKSSFTPTVAGIYVGTLLVNDGKLNSPPATVAITVTP